VVALEPHLLLTVLILNILTVSTRLSIFIVIGHTGTLDNFVAFKICFLAGFIFTTIMVLLVAVPVLISAHVDVVYWLVLEHTLRHYLAVTRHG
jgi:hypothetical protein